MTVPARFSRECGGELALEWRGRTARAIGVSGVEESYFDIKRYRIDQGRAFTAFELFAGVPQLLSILAGAALVTLVDYRIPMVVMSLGISASAIYAAMRLRGPDPAAPMPDEVPQVSVPGP